MKILVTRQIPSEALDLLQQAAELEVWPSASEAMPRARLLEAVRTADGLYCLISERIDRDLISQASRLRAVATMSVGFDHIDISACSAHGVAVVHTPGVLTETTADLAFALILAASRRLGEAERAVRQGTWGAWSPLWLTGQDVYGKTLGLIGLGAIGQAVARRARGFDMQLVYWSRTRKPEAEAALGLRFLELPELLRQADVVSLHVPLSAETRHLIGREELAQMKRTAVLVNTARGPVVDEAALVAALERQQIMAAGLDVYEREPLPLDHPLQQLPNVVLLPHIGSASRETRTRMAVLAAKELLRCLQGEKPHHLLNPEVWPV